MELTTSWVVEMFSITECILIMPNAGTLDVEPIVSFPLEMGLKCRTLVQKFYEMENGDVITPVYPALMFSITHSGRNNIYGVFGTYKCRRCRKLKRRVKPPQGLIH